MTKSLLSRLAGWSLVLCAAGAFNAPARAQAAAPATRLDRVVVSAARTPQDVRLTPSSVTALSLPDLQLAQIGDLKTALAGIPGVIVVNTGATGGQSSLFLRGANADQTLILVDGVRLNTPQADYLNFLGGADLSGLERLEVLRGPQSTLYGGSAMGGVILAETAAAGAGPTSGLATLRAGSFSTLGASLATRGDAGPLGYSLSLGRQQTDNHRPDNAYKNTSYSLRAEAPAAPGLLLGLTLRGQVGDFDDVGSELYPSSGRANARTHLVTAYAQWRPTPELRSRLTAAWHQGEYTYLPKPAGSFGFFHSRNTRRLLDWQNVWESSPAATFVAGANAEFSHHTTGSPRLSDRLSGAYLSAILRPATNTSLDAGVRIDHYDFFGSATTARIGAAHRLPATGTKLRATYGTGFKAPSTTNRFGMPPYYGASPAISPEKSTGWDAGIDQEIAGDRLVASLTWFQNRFRDLISNNYSGTTRLYHAANLKRARTEGVEVSLAARPLPTLDLRAAYTHLSALDTSGSVATRLVRRPRHTLDLDARQQLTRTWLVGAGLHGVADRRHSASVALEDYTTVRLYAGGALTPTLSLKLRLENALDERYAEVLGYPALPRAVFGSLEWKF